MGNKNKYSKKFASVADVIETTWSKNQPSCPHISCKLLCYHIGAFSCLLTPVAKNILFLRQPPKQNHSKSFQQSIIWRAHARPIKIDSVGEAKYPATLMSISLSFFGSALISFQSFGRRNRPCFKSSPNPAIFQALQHPRKAAHKASPSEPLRALRVLHEDLPTREHGKRSVCPKSVQMQLISSKNMQTHQTG